MSRTINPNIQYEKNGKPIVGGKVYYGVANQDPKTNLITIFSDQNLTIPITNPQHLDGQGRLSGAVYVGVNQYSFQVDDNLDNQQLSDPQLEPMNIVGLVTASIDLNGFKIVNAADATANSEYATFGQNNELYAQVLDADASSTVDAIVANLPVSPASLSNGQRVIVRLASGFGSNATITPTFKLNSFSAFTITRDNNDSLLVGDTGGGRYYLDLTFSPSDNRWHLSNPFNLRDDAVSTAKVLDNNITNAKLSDMVQSTIKGRADGAGTGGPVDLTPTEVRAIINVEDGATAGKISLETKSGLRIINNVADSDHDIDVASGFIGDSTGAYFIDLLSSITKQIDAVWAEGTNSGGRASAVSLTTNTWYRVFIIAKPDGTTDLGFDTSSTATNLLADATGYTLFRRIGWVLTNAISNITEWVYGGKNTYTWDDHVFDNFVFVSLTAQTEVVRAPPNQTAKVIADFISSEATGESVYITQLDAPDVLGAAHITVLSDGIISIHNAVSFYLVVSPASLIRHRGTSVLTTLSITTLSWVDDIEVA